MSLEEQKALESEYVMGTFARKPICLVEGKGMKVVDDQGRELLDFIAGIGVCSLGHCHPAVVQAVADQASKLIHVSNYYYIEKRGQVARMLSDLLNWGLEEGERFTWQSFFSNSGAESNECAMKLARLYARRFGNGGTDIVTLERSFHGRTMETLAATAQPAKQEAFQPVPGGFLHTPINDLPALKALFDDPANKICAVMVEPIQGESGVHPCTAEFLQGVQRLCREHGALVIADEVQTGIYRTGKTFGFQNFGIVPDIVSMAKGIASGFPTGACAAKKEVACAFEAGDHGTTGFIGVRYLLEVLADWGHADAAMRIVQNPTAPSWRAMLDTGATAITESWNGTADPDKSLSMAHFSLGSVAGWFFEYLGGIRVNESDPGMRRVVLRPVMRPEIGRFGVRYRGAFGEIRTEWKFVDGQPVFTYRVPGGVTAEIIVPAGTCIRAENEV